MNRTFVSVIVVGAGPTGLTVANLLGMVGVDTLLLERNATLNDFPRAISIDDEGLRICQALGLGSQIGEHVLLDIGARYLSGGRLLARVAPTSKRYGYPLISTFDQPALEAVLLSGLQRFACVDVRFQHRLESFEMSEEGVSVSVRTSQGMLQHIECAYLLACDGGKSAIRRALHIPLRGARAHQRWLVVDSVHDADLVRYATFFCDPARPSVSVPAPNAGRRWEFMLLPGESEADLLRGEVVQKLIQAAGGPLAPQITRQAIYTFYAMRARRFSQGRVFLLGDAAHMLPPFGGQGMNSGLRDAHNLAWKLSLVLRQQADPRLLTTYHQERYVHATRMIRFSSFLGSVIMPTQRPLAFVRDVALRLATAIPVFRTLFAEAGIKPQPRYRRGCVLSDRGRASRAIAGHMLPQPEVLTVQGERILLDEALGAGFAMLRLYPDPLRAFAPLKSVLWKRLDARFVCVLPVQGGAPLDVAAPTPACTVVLDVQGGIADFLHAQQDMFVVVRPDRYVLGAFSIQNEATFAASVQRLLFPHLDVLQGV